MIVACESFRGLGNDMIKTTFFAVNSTHHDGWEFS